MTTVYLVSSGSYSDYSVRGIYSTLEKAEARARLVSDANEVSEFELDEGIELIQQGLNSWVVDVWDDGEIRAFQDGYSFSEAAGGQVTDRRNQGQCGRHIAFHFYVFARDEAHALKIAQDKRAEYLAKEAGVTE